MEKTPKSHAGRIDAEDLKKLAPKIAFIADSTGQTEDVREEHAKPPLQRQKEEIDGWLKTLPKKNEP